MTRRAAPMLFLVTAACAYYNGIYNAKALANAGDKLTLRGEAYAATQSYLKSAITAETVLSRHPKTRWKNDALYFAARGYALGDNCARGLRRLSEYLEANTQQSSRRERALVAEGACLVAQGELFPADSILAPLVDSRDAAVRGEAALWDGRAWLRLGDAARAESLLARVPGAAASWEFMAAAFQVGNLERAESLLVVRATAGDWLSVVPLHVQTLWGTGRTQGAARVVDLYGVSRVSTDERVKLRFLLSDLAADAGDTALARRQATEAQRIGMSPAFDADARARLLALRIREFDQLSDVEAAVVRDSARARGTVQYKRMKDNLTLIRMLLNNPDVAGAHLFLSAEIARDSLHAYQLAHAMFRSIEREFGDYEIAARALLAATAIVPDSTAVYRARIIQKWDSSSAAFALRGLDPAYSKRRAEDVALDRAWRFAMTQWAETLKVRRIADSIAALGVRRQ